MKLIHTCLVALIMSNVFPTQSHALSSYTPGILCASGAVFSAAGTFWAHKKIKALEAVNDLEKNDPKFRKSMQRWKACKDICKLTCVQLGSLSIGLLRHAYQTRQWIQRSRYTEKPNEHEQAKQAEQQEKNRLMREQIAKQNEIAKQREKERVAEARKRDPLLIKKQEIEIKEQTGPSLINAAQRNNLAEVKRLVARYADKEIKNQLLNARDEFGKTAGYYARQRGNRTILAYILEQAARQADNECPICFEEINDTSCYAVGSPSFNCIHFVCTNCLKGLRRGYIYPTDFGFDEHVHGKMECPTCKQE